MTGWQVVEIMQTGVQRYHRATVTPLIKRAAALVELTIFTFQVRHVFHWLKVAKFLLTGEIFSNMSKWWSNFEVKTSNSKVTGMEMWKLSLTGSFCSMYSFTWCKTDVWATNFLEVTTIRATKIGRLGEKNKLLLLEQTWAWAGFLSAPVWAVYAIISSRQLLRGAFEQGSQTVKHWLQSLQRLWGRHARKTIFPSESRSHSSHQTKLANWDSDEVASKQRTEPYFNSVF